MLELSINIRITVEPLGQIFLLAHHHNIVEKLKMFQYHYSLEMDHFWPPLCQAQRNIRHQEDPMSVVSHELFYSNEIKAFFQFRQCYLKRIVNAPRDSCCL